MPHSTIGSGRPSGAPERSGVSGRGGGFRRPVLPSVALALSLNLVASCGFGGPEDSSDRFEVWALEDEILNPILDEAMANFNATSEVQGTTVYFPNDPYKQRLQVGMAASNPPDVFFNWGAGNLAQYVDEGRVMDLTEHLDQHPGFRDAFLPSVLEVAELDDRVYGVPMLGVQPIVLFYNERVFAEAGVRPPETYEDLLLLVDVFAERDVTPIALPGAQSWTLLMWLSYLVDRIGGSEVYEAISENEENAWHDPAILEAVERCQDLVERGAFGADFSSLTYDDGAASELLAEGEAAMLVMGSWETLRQAENNPEFIAGGDLGFVPFPEVEGGAGDPAVVIGSPSNYFSVHAESPHKEAALRFLTEHLTSDQYVNGLMEIGAVPPVVGIEDRLAQTEQADYTTFVYDLVVEAPVFTLAWDQDLDPTAAETMLTSLELIFEGEMPPEQFAEIMSETQW